MDGCGQGCPLPRKFWIFSCARDTFRCIFVRCATQFIILTWLTPCERVCRMLLTGWTSCVRHRATVAQSRFATAQESRYGMFSHDSGLQFVKVSASSHSLFLLSYLYTDWSPDMLFYSRCVFCDRLTLLIDVLHAFVSAQTLTKAYFT